MMMKKKSLAAALSALALSFPHAARAAELTDHWVTEGESGWGLNAVQQGEALFATLFVYAADGTPQWYVADARRYGLDAAGNAGFAGTLYRTTGPWLGGAFDPAAVRAVPVGRLTFQANGASTATLDYEVNGVKVGKRVSRMTMVQKDWTGLYYAAQRANYIGCEPGYTPAFLYDSGFVDVQHEGSRFDMQFRGAKATCDYRGSYRQAGRVGAVSGTYQCSDGMRGSFDMNDMETSDLSMALRIKASHPRCQRMVQGVSALSLHGSP